MRSSFFEAVIDLRCSLATSLTLRFAVTTSVKPSLDCSLKDDEAEREARTFWPPNSPRNSLCPIDMEMMLHLLASFEATETPKQPKYNVVQATG